jgi:hypothetical protein
MKNDLECIHHINRYLIKYKNDYEKRKIIRMYLTSKVGSVLNKNRGLLSSFLDFQLGVLSI